MLTPVGNTVDETWANIKAGKSGIGPIEHFDATGFNTRFSGPIRNFDAGAFHQLAAGIQKQALGYLRIHPFLARHDVFKPA